MKYFFYILLLVGITTSCTNDDYLNDGGVHDPHVYKTTYDYLVSNPLFDTLVMVIDKANLKDEVNAAKTFYAPTNFSINNYIRAELEARLAIDAEAVYTFDSIPVTVFDSLRMYMYDEYLTRDSLTKEGKIYTSKFGKEYKLSKEPFEDYQDDLTIQPEYLFFINKVGDEFDTYDETQAGGIPTNEKDERVRVQTSGLISTTGMIHVLENKHMFLFHEVIYNP